MRKKLTRVAAAAMVVAGLAIAGAAATPAPSALSAPSVTPSTALEKYLATGILPADVSREPGVWNFAGAASACPGPGWNCAILGVLPITQVGTVNVIQCIGINCAGSTQTGYTNTFECQPAPTPASMTNTDALQECVITQGGTHNQAKCVEKKKTTSVRQRCSITQTGQDNQATIVQVADQVGPTLFALQEAGVSQTPGAATTSKNQLQVDQEVKQYTETYGAQEQDAYQVVAGPFGATAGTPPLTPSPGPTATQTAAGSGDNQAQITQKQTQRAKDGSTQEQNDGVPIPPDDCNDDTAISPEDPNLCANIGQTSGSGDNQLQLTQLWDVEATTTYVGSAGTVQQQGAGPFTGGDDGKVHQQTMAPGFSKNDAFQSEVMRLFAPPGSSPDQEQHGGAGCCGFGSQVGPGTEVIDQKKDLEAIGGTEQTAILVGTSSSPMGDCFIDHDVQTNSDEATASEFADPCVLLAVFTVCENTGGNGDEEVGACQEVVVCGAGSDPDIDVSEGINVNCNEEDIIT